MASSFRKSVMRGQRVVTWLSFLAALVISIIFTTEFWFDGAEPAYIAMSFVPATVTVVLAVMITPRLWRRMAVSDGRFDPARGAFAGAAAVLLVHLITIELFLAVGYVLTKLSGEASLFLDDLPWLVLTAPAMSVYRLGWLTLPAGMAIGWGVAFWCQRKMQ